jgi:hypothetical protein
MDKQDITRAAEAALGDLNLDGKVNDVIRSPSGDKWCVQFSGHYAQLCDEFKDQFGEENGPAVVREKIKRYLLKQVTKIRNTTGKTRRPRSQPSDKQKSSATSKSFGFIGDALERASQIAGEVAERASGVAGAARDAVVDVAEKLTPVTVELRGVSNTKARKPSQPSKQKKTVVSRQSSKGKAKASPSPRAAKKTSRPTTKSGGKKNAGSKKRNDSGRRVGR